MTGESVHLSELILDGPPICPSKSPPSVHKSLEVLEKLMEYMNASDSTFRFWYFLFRDNYLSVSYYCVTMFSYNPLISLGILPTRVPAIRISHTG